MSRARVLAAAALLLAAGCGAPSQDAPASAWRAAADEAFAAGDDLRAAGLYRSAFAMEDPVEERRDARALLAFRRARSLSRAVLADPGASWSEGTARRALLWFDQVLRLRPGMHQVWYERAVLHESELAAVRDLGGALEAYERYLRAVDERGEPSAAEAPRVERARARVAALSGGLAPR